jgi:thiol-disulfide isomerase/thioredoxin
MMRPVAIGTALGVLFFAATSAKSADLAPDWSLKSADGNIVRLSEEIREQPAILFFWATWCPYCKALMPHLQSMRLEYGDQVEILAINFREDGDPVAFIKNAGYDFTVLPDGDEVAAAYGVHGTPGVIIVDTGQHIRFDLRALPVRDPPANGKPPGHKRKAAYKAPYWAAEIRKSVDSVLENSSQ